MQPKTFTLISGAAFILSFALTSCGATEDATPSPTLVPKSESVGTGGKLIRIQSDNVLAAGYDADSMVMTVQFKNGYIYEYYGISVNLWDSFLAAQPNPWSLIGYPRLVQAAVPYKRIG